MLPVWRRTVVSSLVHGRNSACSALAWRGVSRKLCCIRLERCSSHQKYHWQARNRSNQYIVVHRRAFSNLSEDGTRTSSIPKGDTVAATPYKRANEENQEQDEVNDFVRDRSESIRIIKTLKTHLWPSNGTANANQIKTRIGLSLSLMLAAKVISIRVPFIFKDMVDTLTPMVSEMEPGIVCATAAPVSLVLAYGMARATAIGAQELRNVVFSTVANQAIQRVAMSVFIHLHNMDVTYHQVTNVGVVTRVIDRGGRSIQYVLNSMVFNVVPTFFEICLVCGILAHTANWQYSSVCFGTIGAYTAYTIVVTQWRTKFRKAMLSLENEASAQITDSLLNYETVKFFQGEKHEVRCCWQMNSLTSNPLYAAMTAILYSVHCSFCYFRHQGIESPFEATRMLLRKHKSH